MASCLVIIHAFLAQKNIVKPTYRFYQVEWQLLRGIFAVGGPAVMGNLVHPIGMSLLFFLLKPYGDASKAALTMGLTYQQVAILPIIGIGAATLTMAGQNYGAEQFERIRVLNVKAVLFTISVLTGVTLLFLLFSEPFARVFSDSVDVIRIGRTLLIITSLGFPAIGMRLIYASLFQGLGMGMKALVLNIGQLVLFSFPLAWLLSQWIGLIGIWWGMTAGVFITAFIGRLWVSMTLRTLKTEKL
jgi:Na+-driven multidrug efflux pump